MKPYIEIQGLNLIEEITNYQIQCDGKLTSEQPTF